MAENSFPVKNVQNIKRKKITLHIVKWQSKKKEAKTINIGSALEQTVSVVLRLLHLERWKVTRTSRAPATTDGRLACHFRRRGLSSVPSRRDTCSGRLVGVQFEKVLKHQIKRERNKKRGAESK